MLRRTRLVIAVGVSASIGGLVPALSSSAQATSQRASQSVIVVLKNQDRAQPAARRSLARRRNTIRDLQAPLLHQLLRAHAKDVHSYLAVDAVSATVTPSERAALARSSAVSEVVPNGFVTLAPTTSGAAAGAAGASGAGTAPVPGACPAPGKVQLDPEALETIHADSDVPGAHTARSLGIDGSGVSVGFIADAINPNDPDFIRADGQHVVTRAVDFSGFGTAAPTDGAEGFGDASMIAAQGRRTYDVSHYSGLPLNRPCDIRVEGVAPGANLVELVAFGESDVAPDSSILEAIDYAITTAHVNVLNESFGINNYPDDAGTSLDLIAQANDEAVAAGITVVEASGDAGPTSTIGEDADDPAVISAGATTDYRLLAQDGYGGARFPEVKGWLDDNISSLSSSGFDQRGRAIDLVAPGELDWALCSRNLNRFAGCEDLAGKGFPVQAFGGTSEASPVTAGVAALVIDAYEKTHDGTAPTPAQVKQLIVSNTDDIGAPSDEQGTGRVDAYKAVLAAENDNQPAGGGSAQGRQNGVVTTSASQLNAVDQPGTPESLTDTVTNESATTQQLSFAGRTLGPSTSLYSTDVTLSDSGPQTPDYVAGDTDNYQRVTFTVPSGEARLSASAAFHNALAPSLAARVRITLIDPNGELADYSLPQGNGNYGTAQVASPAAGTWTAYIWSRDSTDGGTVGPVLFGVSAAEYAPFGTVAPASATLAPGQSVAVRVQTSTPAQPGDESGAIVVRSTAGGSGPTTSTTIPVTLRSLIPAGNTTFAGTVTGGNGRDPISGQEFFYQLDVPAGQPELNATITVQDPGNQFGAYLIDPQGEAVAYATNMTPGPGGPGALGASPPSPPTNQLGAQLHTLAPPPGRWRLAIVFAPAASGDSLASPFSVNVNDSAVPATRGGVPNNAGTQLTAGQAYTYDATVTNTGTAPELFFPDGRLSGSASLPLDAAGTPTTPGEDPADDNLPTNDNIPVYLVPTDSTQFSASATASGGSTPLLFESQYVGGDPDLPSTIGPTANLSWTDDPIAQGEWDVLPIEYGAFGRTGGPNETADTSASVTTSPFDPAVSSATGDLEADSVDPSASLSSFAPISVPAGQTATIPVTITPSGASGTTVSGTLYLDDAAYFEFGSIQDALVNYPQADQVAAIPYSYTIK